MRYFVEVPDDIERTMIAHGHDNVMYRIVERPYDKNYQDRSKRRIVTDYRTDDKETEPVCITDPLCEQLA